MRDNTSVVICIYTYLHCFPSSPGKINKNKIKKHQFYFNGLLDDRVRISKRSPSRYEPFKEFPKSHYFKKNLTDKKLMDRSID